MFESFKRRVASAIVSDDILLKGLLIGKDGALRKRLGGGHGKTSKTEFFRYCLSSQAINPSQAGSNHLVNKTLGSMQWSAQQAMQSMDCDASSRSDA